MLNDQMLNVRDPKAHLPVSLPVHLEALDLPVAAVAIALQLVHQPHNL